MKRLIALVLVVLALSASSLLLFAHSGRTDSNGGHWNHFSGEYHYHHGYGAHQHYDMDGDGYKEYCPIDPSWNKRARPSQNDSTTVETKDESSSEDETTFLDVVGAIFSVSICWILMMVLGIIGGFEFLAYFVSIPPKVLIHIFGSDEASIKKSKECCENVITIIIAIVFAIGGLIYFIKNFY